MKTAILILVALLSIGAVFSMQMGELLNLRGDEITPEIIDLITANNATLSRTGPSWNFGTSSVPVPLPRPGDDPFLEDIPWQKDFSSHIVYDGTDPLFLFYNTPSQRFNISTDPVNPLKLHFTVRPEMAHWYGTETLIIGVSDTPGRDPNRAFATAVVRITVSPVDDPIILDCPPEFIQYDDEGNITHYEIQMMEDASLTINFLDYNGLPLIKTVDNLNNPANYDFFITQTQPIPYDVEMVQTPAYVGKTVTFTPRPDFFGEVTFTITNVDNNVNGFLDANPDFNTSINVFVLKVFNENDAPVIRAVSPQPYTQELVQFENKVFSVRTFDADDEFIGFDPPNTELTYEWRITGSEYGSPIDLIFPHTLSADPANPRDVISSIDYSFDYPGEFQVTLTVSDDVVTLPVLVWIVTVLPAGPEFTIQGYPPNIYYNSIEVGLFSTASPSAPIYYTLDGSLPDQNSLLFNPANPIQILASNDDVMVTITSVYYDPVYGQSGITSQTYYITGTVETPIFSLLPLPNIYTSPQLLEISTGTVGATIRYTLDGSDPTETHGIVYTGAIPIGNDSSISVKAIAYKTNWLTSSPISGSFMVTGQVRIDELTFDQPTSPFQHILPQGAYLTINLTSVLLHPNDADTRLYFTLDNSTPDENSELYVGQSIMINQSTIIRFRAFRDNWDPSTVRFFEFIINGQVIILSYGHGSVFNPDPSVIYTGDTNVMINTTAPAQGSRIYYTTSDDPDIEPPDPTEASTFYPVGGVIPVSPLAPYEISYKRIKTRAYHDYLAPSPVYQANYTVTGQVLPPVFSPPGGAYFAPVLVSISSAAPGAQIRYTYSDNLSIVPPDPQVSNNPYTGSFLVPLGTRIIKARVFKDDWAPSEVVTAVYYVGILQAPTFDPVASQHFEPIFVSINHSDPEAVIRWEYGTVVPTSSSPIYSAPIYVDQNTTITAMAFRQDWAPSAAVSKSYVITGTLSDLTFTPPNYPGTYINSVFVGIHHDDPTATIRYTLNGEEPTLSTGFAYTGPFEIVATTLVRARAFRNQWNPSEILEGLYEIVETVAAPIFTPPSGTYTNPVNVFIFSYTINANIRYTLDGTDPSPSTGTLYVPDNPILVDSNSTIKAIAYVSPAISSVITTANYQITGFVETPYFDPAPGVYASTQFVSIYSDTPDAEIYYTLDGSIPSQSSLLFSALNPIAVSQSTVIKAIALKTGWLPSAISTASYVINGQIATPIFIPAGGSYFDVQSVVISTNPPDAQIYYTTDGSEPTENPALLFDPLNPVAVDQSMTIKAKAYRDTWLPSLTGQAVYVLNVLPPLVNFNSGIYPEPIQIELTNQNPGATIYYTTDGSAPLDVPANLYTGAFTISANTRLRAIAYRDGWTPSPELDLAYAINQPLSTPQFSVADQTIAFNEFMLSITGSPADAQIYYTLDGSDPDQNSMLYSSPILIDQNRQIKARAFKDFHNPSAIGQASYYLKVTAPQASFNSGTYYNPINLTLNTTTANAEIRYTSDGSDPGNIAGTLYENPIMISEDSTIKAIAYRNNWLNSDISTSAYEFTVGPISFNPPAGSYPGDIAVQISSLSIGSSIRYTINDLAPTVDSGILYTTPITINEPSTIRAIAYMGNLPVSTAEANYVFKLPAPEFSHVEGVYFEDISLGLSTHIPGVDIYYTLDGSDPLTNGMLYTVPILINNPQVLRAVSTKLNWDPSVVVQASYQFKVATPAFDPPAGLYGSSQNIEISTITDNTSIYYTTDESTPTIASTPYTAPVFVENGMFVFKALATRAGWIDSDIGEAGYIIGSGSGGPSNTVATPVLLPPPGLYTTQPSISMSISTPEATIRYTLDGSDPTLDNGMEYTAPFVLPLDSTTTVKAIGFRTGWNNSQMAAGTYIVTGTVSNLVFSPLGGTYTEAQTVVITTSTEGATIRYTTDGTDPVANSSVYTTGIVLPNNTLTIIKARAYKTGWTSSPIESETYNITGTVSLFAPVFDPSPGTYQTPQSVSITGVPMPSAAVIRYTTDGSDPTESSPIYSSAWNVGLNSTLNLKVRAFMTGWIPSPIYSAVYTVTGQVAAVNFSIPGGIYQTVQNVVLSTTTPGATIRYTSDGNDPTEASASYSSPINIPLNTPSMIIKASAYLSGWDPSLITEQTYTVTGQIVYQMPVFNPAPGTYQTAQSIALNGTSPSDAVIYYSTDGSEPTEASTPYTGAINIPLNSTLMIKTKAFKADWTPSITHTGVYTTTGTVSILDPVFDPAPGLFTTPQNIVINTATAPAGATIRYTTDGSDPSESSPIYSEAIPVNTGQTVNIRARAFATDWLPSSVYSGAFTVTGQVSLNAPVFTPAAGTYTSPQIITLNTLSNPTGAILRYTTDGSEPDESSSIYTTGIPVNGLMTIKVKAYLANWIPSETYTAVYNVTGQVSFLSEVFSPMAGTYQELQWVSISDQLNPADASVYYTIDGTIPDMNSTLYTAPIALPLNSTTLIRARAYQTDWIPSPVYSANYIITGQVQLDTPVFNPLPGIYQEAQTVAFEPAILPSDATLRYTLDGSIPNLNSPAYTAPVSLPMGTNTTITVRGFKGDWIPSEVVSGTYYLTGQVQFTQPVFSPTPGTYGAYQTVSISSTIPSDATVIYTIDGSEPTADNGTTYTGAFDVLENTTIKAIALKDNWIPSPIQTANYSFGLPAPVLSLPAGSYAGTQTVSITVSVADASIRYTLDGSDPSTVNGIEYSLPINITQSALLKAIAVKPGWNSSSIVSAWYSINGAVANPNFNPISGTYFADQTLSISTFPPDATIRYTTDGSNPSPTTGTIYTAPVSITQNTTLKAIAYKTDWLNSQVSTAIYTLQTASPQFSLAQGTYTTAQTLALSVTTPGAQIRYTTNGTDPSTTTGTIYTAPIQINATQMVKAIAYKANWNSSPIITNIYTITGQVASVIFNPVGGTYQTAQNIVLSTTTPGATIRYTTNGSDPTEASASYSAPINIPLNTPSISIKARAYLSGWDASAITQQSYTITGQVTFNQPIFTPAAGTYQIAQTIALSAPIPTDATIRYTIDGTDPTLTTGTIYTAPFILGTSATVKAIAYKTDWITSGIVSATYNFAVTSPSFSPPAGSYSQPQTVTISSVTDGVTIRYTLDGSEPSSSTGTIYANPVNIAQSSILKAIAYKGGWNSSPVSSAVYAINGAVADPVFNPVAGTYSSDQSVAISAFPPDATIRYTTNGIDPSPTSGTIYTAPVSITQNTTLKAIAYKTDWLNSQVSTAIYTLQTASPQFSLAQGTYTTAQTLTLTVSTPGAQIRYTTNGSDPSPTTGTVYTAPISINATQTVKAIAYKANWNSSPIITNVYTITGQVASVTFNPVGGTYQTAQNIVLSTTTPGATIRYTTNGSDPTEASASYSTPINIPLNTASISIKARAYLTDWVPSAITQQNYTITGQVSFNQPIFNPAAGTYQTAQSITISAPIPADATIRYTTDGSDPTATSPIYSTPIPIPLNTTMTIKVRGFRANWTDSQVFSATYNITGQVTMTTPVFSPMPGTYTSPQQITINTVTVPAGATIRYTTDGSDPSLTNGTVYTEPITLGLDQTLNLRARAFLADWIPSTIYSATYTVTGQVVIPDPVFSPAAGTYSSMQFISLNNATVPAGATLRFTLNGTDPTQSSDVYLSAIALPLNNSYQIRVKAFKAGWEASPVYTANYLITGQVSFNAPVFDPPAGIYQTAQQISISNELTPVNAAVYYSTDGSDPDMSSTPYTSPIPLGLNSSSTLKVRAYSADWVPSPVYTAVYTITGVVQMAETPFLLPEGIYTTAQTLTLAPPVLPVNAIIRYTLDGNEPTEQSPAYTSPINLALDTVTMVRIKAYAENWIPSQTYSATYAITGTVSPPVFSQPGGLYHDALSLALETSTPGAEIRYTLDGSEPDGNSTLYEEPILVPELAQNLQVKARTFKSNWISSSTVSNTYSVLLLPINVRAFTYSGYIRVLWNSPIQTRVLDGFNVYRKRNDESAFTKINQSLINTQQNGDYYYDDYAIRNNYSYQYYVTAVYNGMESNPSQTTTIEYQSQDLTISDVSHAYPNPASTSCKIKIVLSRNDNVQLSISIFDFAGKKVQTLTVPTTNANLIEIPWDLKTSGGVKVARGTYFARIAANDGINRAEKVIKIAVK